MDFIPVNEPLLDGNEKKYVFDCIESGWISSAGKYVNEFEEKCAAYFQRKYAVAVSNGTTALEAAVAALKLEKGSEVILPAFTIISCGNAVIKNGLVPVFVDADKKTWNMDVNSIEKVITKKTRAIMVVHIYGLPVEMDKIREIANKYNLYVIEDAAEAQGLEYRGKKCGSFGDVSVMSFFANKHITTGEGGMVLADNIEIIQRARDYGNLFFDKERKYIHAEIGSNFRMTNIQAAIGCAQLEKIDEHIKKKQIMAQLYNELLRDNHYFMKPLEKNDYATNVYWVYGLVINENYDIDATRVMEILHRRGIGTRHFFCPLNLQPAYQENDLIGKKHFPVAEMLMRKGFYIPLGYGINEEQVRYVADVLNEIKV